MTFTDKKRVSECLNLPEFYLDALNKCKKRIFVSEFDKMTQVIWCNDNFIFKGKYIFFTEWIQSGFIMVKDFLDENNKCLESQSILEKLEEKRDWISQCQNSEKNIT